MSNFNEILGIVSVEQLKEGARLARRNSGKGCVLCDYSGYTNNIQGKAVMCSCQKEKIFADLVEQMSAASKKMTLLGKRIREEAFSTDDLERQYLSLPVDQRPSWFQYIAEHATTKKFAPKKANTGLHTQDGHTQ